MNTLTIDQLEQKGVLRLTRGEIMKSDSEIANSAPILRPSDVVHNRAPEWESEESDEPLHVDLPTARIGDVAVCLHFAPGSTCLITESFDGAIPTKGIVLVSINGTIGKIAFYNNEKIILGKSACYFNLIKGAVNDLFLFHIYYF